MYTKTKHDRGNDSLYLYFCYTRIQKENLQYAVNCIYIFGSMFILIWTGIGLRFVMFLIRNVLMLTRIIGGKQSMTSSKAKRSGRRTCNYHYRVQCIEKFCKIVISVFS